MKSAHHLHHTSTTLSAALLSQPPTPPFDITPTFFAGPPSGFLGQGQWWYSAHMEWGAVPLSWPGSSWPPNCLSLQTALGLGQEAPRGGERRRGDKDRRAGAVEVVYAYCMNLKPHHIIHHCTSNYCLVVLHIHFYINCKHDTCTCPNIGVTTEGHLMYTSLHVHMQISKKILLYCFAQ